MKNPPIRFCGISLHHNPERLKISLEDNIYELVSPCCEPDSLSMGAKLRRVTGEGELYGADCLQQFFTLENLQRSHQRSKLILHGFQPMYAFLSEFSLSAEPTDDVLKYTFTFIEAQSPSASYPAKSYYTVAADGESLWDIAYKYGVDISALVELNPQIEQINSLSATERVRLC